MEPEVVKHLLDSNLTAGVVVLLGLIVFRLIERSVTTDPSATALNEISKIASGIRESNILFNTMLQRLLEHDREKFMLLHDIRDGVYGRRSRRDATE